MKLVNRAAIVVRPKARFLEWLHSVHPASLGQSLEDLREEPSCYLIPEREDDVDGRKELAHLCDRICREEFEAWFMDRSSMPAMFDLETFEKWFDWSFHSLVFDLGKLPLKRH